MSGYASRLTAVHRGTAFEERSLQHLQAHFSMALRRVGGKADGGVDLAGWWWLPFATTKSSHNPGAFPDPNGLLRRRLRILAQCKAEKKKFSPKYVREMEGVWHLHSRSPSSLAAHHPSPLKPSPMTCEPILPEIYPTVALLISESSFSKFTILHAYRSTVPFLLIHLPRSSSSSVGDIDLGIVYPNPTLTEIVKPLAFCWERNPSAIYPTETEAYVGGRPGLWWQGRKLGSWTPEFRDSDAT